MTREVITGVDLRTFLGRQTRCMFGPWTAHFCHLRRGEARHRVIETRVPNEHAPEHIVQVAGEITLIRDGQACMVRHRGFNSFHNPPGGLHPGNYRFICTGETARWFCIRLNPRIGLLPYGREFVHLPPGGTVTVAAGRRLLVCDGVLNGVIGGVIGGAAGRFGQLNAVPRADHDRVFMAEGEVLGLQLWPAPSMPGQGPGDDRLIDPAAKGQKT